MLLTLSAPTKSEFEFKSPHDFSSNFSSAPKRQSPPSFALSTSSHPPAPPPDSARPSMSTPHRGLPPPAAMTLPDPQRGQSSITPSLGQMPAPPSQWQGAEDSMRNWLAAKAEEDKRKQEEEKTRQETLRLEQRKIESNMLRDSMAGGIPPHMVPIIFAGIGGANLASASIDWLQQYAAQMQGSQQQAITAQPHQGSPDMQRDSRGLLSQGSYTSAPQPPPPASVLQGQPAPSYTYSPVAAGLSPTQRARQLHAQGPTSAPRTSLPRLTTNEMHIAQAPTLQSAPSQEPAASSPSIYFHHWVPPSSQGGASGSGSSKDQPATPTDYTSSPKKRKDTRAHQPVPPPTSAPHSQASPSFTNISSLTSTPPASGSGRGRHARNRSDLSARLSGGRGGSRHPTPPFSGLHDSFGGSRGRTASESAGSRPSREDRIRPVTGSVPGSPRLKYDKH